MKKELLVESLVEKGWFHQENLFDNTFCLELLSEIQSIEWKKAQVGKGQNKQEQFNVRNDLISWINELEATPLQMTYLAKMNELMLLLNRELYLGLKEFECHFAQYQASGFYKKHIDQHHGSHQRVVSAVFYLNEPDNGGELAIYNRHDPEKLDATIKPMPGSFVCFLSNQIYHEVLPTNSNRFSLTGWFRTL